MKASLRLASFVLLFQVSRLFASAIYVSAEGQNPTPPYSSWATAATNIQNAIDLASSIDAVVVTNGVYSGGLLVSKPVILISVNGPSVTTIDGGGTNRCLTISNRTWMRGFTLTNGWAATDGGAVWATYGSALITNCIISGNCASNGGGAFEAALYNCVLASNCASNGAGGGAYFCDLYNCTVTGNSATNGGGAFNGSLYNSIIYYNTAANGPNYAQVSVISNCCATPDAGIAASNIISAPLFIDYAAGNLRLQPASPCIDAGNNFVPRSESDLDGNARIYGSAIDIGAYEFNAQSYGPPAIKVQPLSQTVVPGTNVTFQVVVFGEPPLSRQWWFNNAVIPNAPNSSLALSAVTTNQAGDYLVVVTNLLGAVTSQVAVLTVLPGLPPSFTLQPLSQTVSAGSSVTFIAGATGMLPLSWQWLFNGNPIQDATNSSLSLTAVTGGQSGTYSVTVTNLAGTAISTNATLIVQASGTKYVWQNSPAPTAPYTSWATAAHKIQDAVDASVTGDAVFVTNGIYVGGITVSHPLTLQSVNGPQVTVIDGNGTNSCVFITSDASVSGFTLTNGSGTAGFASGGGAAGAGDSSSLTNCVLTGNRGLSGGGAVWCTLYNCTLTGNWGETNGAAAANCTLYNCLLTGNSGNTNYSTGAAVYGCKLYNNTIVSNSVVGADTCTLYNCISYYNKPSPWNPTYPNYGGSTLNFCCTMPMPAGLGNITNEPLFVDPANGDFHLQPGSPCINAGSNAYAFGTDLDGNPRIIAGTVDIGAFEFQAPLPNTKFVWQNSPSPAAPYTTWATAAHTIQDAVDAASARDTVLVTNGIYATGGRIGRPGYDPRLTVRAALDKPLTLLSVNGPEATVIVGAPPPPGSDWDWGAVSCAYVGNNAVLSGFTLTNGHTFHGATSEFSDDLGGGLYGESSAIVTNCILINNSATDGGGAAGGTLIKCVLIGNVATNRFIYSYGGGGAFQSTLIDCLVISNTAPTGGGALECELVNCTVNGNSSDVGGGAAFSTATNCILYYNTATKSSNSYSNALSYCCTTPLPDTGAQDFTTPPNFLDMAGGNFRLQPGSPCINTGSNAAVAGPTDLDGKPRVFDGTVDLGAYEFQASIAPVIARQPLSQTAPAGATVALDVIVSGTPALSYQWLFNGTTIPTATDSTLTLAGLKTSQSGLYSVIVTNTLGAVTSTVAIVTVHVPVTLYVWQDSANPQPPYTTWSTAAHTIQDAVDAAGPRDEVVVTNGIYLTGGRTAATGTLTNRVAVEQVVTLRSVNGPGATIIQGGPVPVPWWMSTIRCVYLVEGAVLNGFTLSNGVAGVFGTDSSDYLGGGVYCTSTNVLITNCVFSGNGASQGGGAFGGTIIDCVLTGNRGGSGGGCYDSVLTNCVLSGNQGNPGGGACASTLSHCMLTGNVAEAGYGGGAASSVLYDCTLTGNSATNGPAADSSTLYNSILTNNAGWSPAATECTLHNCALTGNAYGGAAGSTLYNCTLTDNQSGGAGYSQLYNCILYNNTASGGANYDASCTLNYCCTTPAPINGVGNITSDPALSSSWRISSSSPCRGAGNAAYASGLDLDGEPWLNPPSIGCDEFYRGSLTGVLSVAITASWTNVATGFVVALDGSITGAASGTRWEFGDGTIESNRLHTSHQWFTPGTYNVQLRAYNIDNPAGVTGTVTIHVVQTPVHYVDLNNALATAPYTSWATAATNIQDAVAVASVPGALVLVSNGVYQTGSQAINGGTPNRVAVDRPIVVQSVNGPTVTVIQGYQIPTTINGFGAIRCVYLSSESVLSGFTLTNGATGGDWTGGGGVYCESTNCVVTNCTLTGNSATDSGGGGAYGGTLYNCTLTSNSVAWSGGGAAWSRLYRCTLTHNSTTAAGSSGGGAFSCFLDHCTLDGNKSSNGGGADFGTLNNCVLVGNQAQNSGGGTSGCTLNDCLLAGNSAAAYGGGGASGCTLNNCTLTGNSAPASIFGYGGGAYNSTLNNCIVYYNSDLNYSESTLNYCCTTPLPTNGVGNITRVPLFVSPDSDFHLQANSPCINAGNNTFVTDSTDLDGSPRIVGGTVDMGAYEFQQSGSVIPLAWLQKYGLPTDGSADFVDTDGDGMNNWEEWVCGTNPTNALSCLRLLSATPTATNTIAVSWQSTSGMNYFVERSTNMALPFTVLTSNLLGQAAITSYADTNAFGPGPFFYRVGVNHP